MKRRFRISWLYVLASCGFSLPGLGFPEMIQALRDEQKQQQQLPQPTVRGRLALPPPNGPERLAPAELSPVEVELWGCIQGDHGRRCCAALSATAPRPRSSGSPAALHWHRSGCGCRTGQPPVRRP